MATQGPPEDGVKRALGKALDESNRRRRMERADAITRWASRKLSETRAPMEAVATTPTKRKPKRSKAKSSRKGVLAEAHARTEVNKVVSKEAQRHDNYQYVAHEFVEVTEGGRHVKKERKVVRNLGGSPIARWHAGGAFDERQMAAILFFQEAHRKAFGAGPRVTANYAPTVASHADGAIDLWARTVLAAKESLRLLDQEVFFREPFDYQHVWLNVVIWEKPAGVAGACTGFIVKKSAEARAKTIVQGLAHKIADIIIDQSRRDFGDLLLDIDAPRRPGRPP